MDFKFTPGSSRSGSDEPRLASATETSPAMVPASSPVAEAAVEIERPPSATHPAVALCGLVAFLASVTYLYRARPFDQVTYGAMLVIGATALGVFVPDLLWQKIHTRPSAGLTRRPAAPSWRRSLIKFAGLLGSMGFIAALYWAFPEYHNPSPFYDNYWLLLRTILPVWLVLALPYIFLTDRRMLRPEDGLWQMGRLVTLRWSNLNLWMIRQHLLGWLIKGYFLPLMFTYMCNDLDWLLNYDVGKLTSFKDYYDFMSSFFYFIDVGLVSMTYLISLRLVDTHIRSSEPTTLGWIVALICYEPFWSLTGRQYLSYESDLTWGGWLQNIPLFYDVWGTLILALVFIYAWATVAFGGRFSNLTHRGIITSGPYRLTKHPAYIAKNLSWWLVSVPFIVDGSVGDSLRRCFLLLLVNFVYYLRAKTEEWHLSFDPVYVQYARWMERHGILRFVNRVPVISAMVRYRPTSPFWPYAFPRPPDGAE